MSNQARMHAVNEDDECVEDCSGCHWEGNLDCEALPWGCDICDPDDRLHRAVMDDSGILAQFSLRGLKHGGIGLRHDPCWDTTVVTVSEPWTLATFTADALTHARACPVSGVLDPRVIGARDADWQVQSVGFLAQGDIYGAALHQWRIKVGERDACAARLLTEHRPGYPTLGHAPNGMPIFIRRTDEPCDCERWGVKLEAEL